MSECVFPEEGGLFAIRLESGGNFKYFIVTPAQRVDCSNYTVGFMSGPLPSGSVSVRLYFDSALYDNPMPQTVLFPQPTEFQVSGPTPQEINGLSYLVEAQWGYPTTNFYNANSNITDGRYWWYSVEWNGEEVSAGTALAVSRSFTESGPVRVRANLYVLYVSPNPPKR